jgi:putative sterol carrier protein
MASAVFAAIAAALPSQGEELVKTIKGDVLFIIDGEAHHLSLSSTAAYQQGEQPADLTVILKEADFMALVSGDSSSLVFSSRLSFTRSSLPSLGSLNPTSAFMSGKVKIKGKMPLAMKVKSDKTFSIVFKCLIIPQSLFIWFSSARQNPSACTPTLKIIADHQGGWGGDKGNGQKGRAEDKGKVDDLPQRAHLHSCY